MGEALNPQGKKPCNIDIENEPAILESAFRHNDRYVSFYVGVILCGRPIKQGSLRMSKIKMRCMTCGKWFQSANAKEVTCPDCAQKARKEKLAAKNAPSPSNKTPGQVAQGTGSQTRIPPPPPKPKPAPSGTSHWFDKVDDIKVAQPDQPQRPKLPSSPTPRDTRSGPGPGGYRDRDERGQGGYREGASRGPGGYRDRDERGPGGYREGDGRGPGGYRVVGGSGTLESTGYRPRQPMESPFGRSTRPGGAGEPRPEGKRGGKPAMGKGAKPTTPPKPKREKIPPPPPFVPTAEQVAQVEARYLELATPGEFDGIRTQIAKELGIPKKAVKKIVKELRERQGIPSWWETQTYKGDSEELEKIKAAYEPYLPVPPVGVHKKIAEDLSLKPGIVYQAIKAIRLEMNLPPYNDPTLHGLELTAKGKEQPAAQEQEKSEAPVSATEAPEPETTTGVVADETEAPRTPVEIAATAAIDGNSEAEQS